MNPFSFICKAYAFQKKNVQESMSYSFSFLSEGFDIAANLAIFFFIGRLVSQGTNPFLTPYGGDYFSFALIGIAFAGIQQSALYSFSHALSSEQGAGTLEEILITSTKLSTVMMSGVLWNCLFVFIRTVFYLLLGILFFQAHFTFHDPLAIAFVLFFSLTAMAGFGMISAGFLLIYKRGDPFSFCFSSASKFLAGVYFPVTVLPLWIQSLSPFFPLTYTLNALRKVLLKGAGMGEVWSDCFVLILFSAVLLPVGIFYFRYAEKRARREGSLTFV